MKQLIYIFVFFSFLTNTSAEIVPKSISQNVLTVYSAPINAPVNNTFSVFVKYDGGEWVDLHEYNAPVDGNDNGSLPQGNMSFVYFDSDYSERIDVKIICNNGINGNVEIRPASAEVQPLVSGNTIEFSITESKKISIEIAGDILNNLTVFANDLEKNIPDPNDPNVIYYGPGIHKIGDGTGTLSIESDKTVYIAGGAIVYGHLEVKHPDYTRLSNVTIRGRGILSADMENSHAYSHPDHHSTPALIHLNVADDVNIEGIILHNSVTWNIHMNFCNNIKVKDIKIISWAINSDGIDPQVSSNVLIDNCFIRNYDDCTSIKLNWFQGNNLPVNANNITIQNSIYWTDKGRAILLGPELASTEPGQVLQGVTVRNLDILYVENYTSSGTDWAKGVIAINAGDGVTVKDILFEDIRVDKLGNETNLFTFNLSDGDQPFTYSGSVGQRIENIVLNRISCNTTPSLPNYINGFDNDKIISGITFNNLKIGGKYINNASEGNFQINQFVENIQFNVSDINNPSIWWKFENSTIDESGQANGNIQGSIDYSSDSKEGDSSIQFNGDGFLNCLDPSITDNLSEFSISFWFKNTETPTNYQTLFGKDGEYRLLITNSKINFTVATENVAWYQDNSNLVSSSNIITDKWYHVVAIYDGTKTKIYINGKLDIENNSTISGNTIDAGGALTICDGANEKFKGLFDDMRFYNTALNSDEVTELCACNLLSNTNEVTNEITIYPNPATFLLTLKNIEENSLISLYSTSGKLIYSQVSKNNYTTLDVREINTGIYFLMIENSKHKTIHKVQITR